MKMKTLGIVLTWLASAALAGAQTNDITTLVQKGLFEEEANRHLDAAIQYYQEAIGRFDKDRQLTATAIFRLGECYRLQGRTNQAYEEYRRVVQEFPDQSQLVELSKNYLPKGSAGASFGTARSTFQENLTKIQEGKQQESAEDQAEMDRLRDMIQNSPDLINAPRLGGETLLTDEIRSGRIRAVKLLLDNGAQVNPPPPTRLPLAVAAAFGNKGIVELLLSKGADVNGLDGQGGVSALRNAVAAGYKAVAETLLARGAHANQPDANLDQPLHAAAARGYISMAELLLAHGADVEARGNGGQTPLFRAVQNNRVEMIQFLISNHANPNAKADDGLTPLFQTSGHGDISLSVLKLLLESGADPNEKSMGKYPIDNVAGNGWTEALKLLIAHHADVNVINDEGNPPLAYAKDPEIRRLLIDAGANEDYERRGGIFIAKKGSGSTGWKMFVKEPNSVNHFTLLDLIARDYHLGPPVNFPDFAHTTINRMKSDGSKEDIDINLEEILGSADCAKNVDLQWGDVVLIPEQDHNLNESWQGLSEVERQSLGKCLARHVTIIVKGQTNKFILEPEIARPRFPGPRLGFHPPSGPGSGTASTGVDQHPAVQDKETTFYGVDLNWVVRVANILLLSSDISRVKLTRSGANPSVMEFNLDVRQPPSVLLQEGDIIEIPERIDTASRVK